MDGSTAKRIVVIDDDLAMEAISNAFRYRGHQARRINSASEALSSCDEIAASDLLILDIIMPWPSEVPASALSGNQTAGMEVYRAIRAKNAKLPIIAYSGTQDSTAITALQDDPAAKFLSKWETQSLRELIRLSYELLGLADVQKPRAFIVHGHNETAKLSLKNLLQNKFHLPEPIILHEQPSLGRTIIEKFEDYAEESSIVCVLLTPDDVGATAADSDDLKRRGRQNVIFEFGYFLGSLGRASGRVLLLYEGPIEMPSDLAGVVYIDIGKGIDAAAEQIRLEIQNVQ